MLLVVIGIKAKLFSLKEMRRSDEVQLLIAVEVKIGIVAFLCCEGTKSCVALTGGPGDKFCHIDQAKKWSGGSGETDYGMIECVGDHDGGPCLTDITRFR